MPHAISSPCGSSYGSGHGQGHEGEGDGWSSWAAGGVGEGAQRTHTWIKLGSVIRSDQKCDQKGAGKPVCVWGGCSGWAEKGPVGRKEVLPTHKTANASPFDMLRTTFIEHNPHHPCCQGA